MNVILFKDNINLLLIKEFAKKAKGLVAELAPPYGQNTWESRRKGVRAARLAVCCNYFSKKKKKIAKKWQENLSPEYNYVKIL